MLIATQTNQGLYPFPISGEIIRIFGDEETPRLIVSVLTPIGPRDIILDWADCTIEERKLH